MNDTARGEFVAATVVGTGTGAWFIARGDDDAEFEVHGVAPGDRVLLRPSPRGARRAVAVALASAGPGRRDPPCPLAGRCGGCHWQQIVEPVQRALRRDHVLAALDAGGVEVDGVPVAAPVGAQPFSGRFRARIQTDFAGGRRRVGFHRLGSRESLDAPSCLMLAPPAARVYEALRSALVEAAPEDVTGFELTALPDADGALVFLNPRDRAPRDWPRLARRLLDLEGLPVTGIAVRSPGITGERSTIGARVMLGRTPAGRPLAAAAGGFLQAHLAAADQLADAVARAAAAGPGARILELFGGSGLLGWRMAAAGALVEAVESDAQSIEAARRLPRPGEGTFTPRRGDARATLSASSPADFDAAVADPPREGLGPAVQEFARPGWRRLVLVSCDAGALARDAAALLRTGFKLVELTLVDLFPQTRHTETVALFRR